jgi:hypothetical protein
VKGVSESQKPQPLPSHSATGNALVRFPQMTSDIASGRVNDAQSPMMAQKTPIPLPPKPPASSCTLEKRGNPTYAARSSLIPTVNTPITNGSSQRSWQPTPHERYCSSQQHPKSALSSSSHMSPPSLSGHHVDDWYPSQYQSSLEDSSYSYCMDFQNIKIPGEEVSLTMDQGTMTTGLDGTVTMM